MLKNFEPNKIFDLKAETMKKDFFENVKIGLLTQLPSLNLNDFKLQTDTFFEDDNIIVRVGNGILKYPGFARMVVEYTVAVIRKGSLLSQLEFNLILQRN